jgi:hypothetical protein
MSARCSSSDISKLPLLQGQIRQYRSMLAATEKAEDRKLFSSHVYDEDKRILQTKIEVRLKVVQTILRQCQISK